MQGAEAGLGRPIKAWARARTVLQQPPYAATHSIEVVTSRSTSAIGSTPNPIPVGT